MKILRYLKKIEGQQKAILVAQTNQPEHGIINLGRYIRCLKTFEFILIYILSINCSYNDYHDLGLKLRPDSPTREYPKYHSQAFTSAMDQNKKQRVREYGIGKAEERHKRRHEAGNLAMTAGDQQQQQHQQPDPPLEQLQVSQEALESNKPKNIKRHERSRLAKDNREKNREENRGRRSHSRKKYSLNSLREQQNRDQS